jgi:hypothetical protein
MNKEQWIDSIIQSGKQLPPVEANPFMATRIAAKLQAPDQPPAPTGIPMRWVYASAAGMALLLLLNILLWSNTTPLHANTGIQQVMQEYGWGNTDLYGMNYSK